MAKLVRTSKPAPKRKALASKVVVEGTGDNQTMTGTKEQLKALVIEKAAKALTRK